MKKSIFAVLIAIWSAMVVPVQSQTGQEIFQSCVDAMGINRAIDSFKTFSIKTILYSQGDRVSMTYMSKEIGEDEHVSRFEQRHQGKEEAFVITNDEFFRVVPNFEMFDLEDAGQIHNILINVFPHVIINRYAKDTSENVNYEVLEPAKFNGKNAKRVKVSDKDDENKENYAIYCFDEASNFYLGFEVPQYKVAVYAESPKRTKGFTYSSVIKVMREGKKTQEFEIDKFEANITLDDKLFSKP